TNSLLAGHRAGGRPVCQGVGAVAGSLRRACIRRGCLACARLEALRNSTAVSCAAVGARGVLVAGKSAGLRYFATGRPCALARKRPVDVRQRWQPLATRAVGAAADAV